MLEKLAENIGEYACFQIESGAQVYVCVYVIYVSSYYYVFMCPTAL